MTLISNDAYFDIDKSFAETKYVRTYFQGGTDGRVYKFIYGPYVLPEEATLPGHTLHSQKRFKYSQKDVYRELNPYDDVPGIGYYAKVRNGDFITNKPYFRKEIWIDSDPVVRQYKYDSDYDTYTSEVIYPSIPSGDDSVAFHDLINSLAISDGNFARTYDNSSEQAVRNLYGSLHRRQDIALGVFLAELKESIGLLGKTMLTIADVITSLRKGRVSDAFKALSNHAGGGAKSRKKLLNRDRTNRQRRKEGLKPLSSSEYASSMWLELQFGWLPILSDIYDLLEVISGSLTSESDGYLYFHGYGSASSEIRNSSNSDVFSVTGTNFFLWNEEGYGQDFSGTLSIKQAYHAVFKVNNDPISILAQLGLINPLSIAWETVPFSFVVDWFLPVGNWIDAMSATAGLELVQHTLSERISVDADVSTTGAAKYSIISRTPSGSIETDYSYEPLTVTFKIRMESFARVNSSADEIPPMPLPSFTFHELLDPWKAVTSLSLLKR